MGIDIYWQAVSMSFWSEAMVWQVDYRFLGFKFDSIPSPFHFVLSNNSWFYYLQGIAIPYVQKNVSKL